VRTTRCLFSRTAAIGGCTESSRSHGEIGGGSSGLDAVRIEFSAICAPQRTAGGTLTVAGGADFLRFVAFLFAETHLVFGPQLVEASGRTPAFSRDGSGRIIGTIIARELLPTGQVVCVSAVRGPSVFLIMSLYHWELRRARWGFHLYSNFIPNSGLIHSQPAGLWRVVPCIFRSPIR